ncbi:hypothetical protein [Cupriavidus numazuensis]|uniref:hypothetical protein n=1 Tax=Cupriavidus numazuensis TaxID=221992 RepID=UPI001BADB835|nr:hypothetical protein [Cupriavidus numazuensis]
MLIATKNKDKREDQRRQARRIPGWSGPIQCGITGKRDRAAGGGGADGRKAMAFAWGGWQAGRGKIRNGTARASAAVGDTEKHSPAWILRAMRRGESAWRLRRFVYAARSDMASDDAALTTLSRQLEHPMLLPT